MTQQEAIKIHIPGPPVGKGRARAYRRPGGGIGHYTPVKTLRWEEHARLEAGLVMNGREPLTGPIDLDLWVTLAIPSSWPTWKQQAALKGTIEPTCKPDLDNVEKAVKDAMNGIVWRDDCQVVSVDKIKTYGTIPGVRVAIRQKPTAPSQAKNRAEVNAYLEEPAAT